MTLEELRGALETPPDSASLTLPETKLRGLVAGTLPPPPPAPEPWLTADEIALILNVSALDLRRCVEAWSQTPLAMVHPFFVH